METVLLIRYAEIHLKGLNRPYFERSLAGALARALAPLPVQVVREQGRIFVFGVPGERAEAAAKRLSRVFGVHSLSIALAVEKDFAAISDAAARLMEQALRERGPATFKVFARRADKRFPMRSADICAELGGVLLDRFAQLKVDVHAPELRVGVEIRQERAFVYAGEIMGPGGMPVGCNGRALLLLSGGAYYTAKVR